MPRVVADTTAYDTFAVLHDGGQYYLSGPVPRNPVRLADPLYLWLQGGACPWGYVEEGGDVILRLANIVMEFSGGETGGDGYTIFTPGPHVWSQDAAWLQGSDGSETAVPRG